LSTGPEVVVNNLPAWLTGMFSDWSAANWIAVSAAALSLLVAGYNNRSATKRERAKNRREDFHRRVAEPIERALEAFGDVCEELHTLGLSDKVGREAFDEIQTMAGKAQRKLSAGLRRASQSVLCSSGGWGSLGADEYDTFVVALDRLRSVEELDRRPTVQQAIEALDAQDSLVRSRIEVELTAYIAKSPRWRRWLEVESFKGRSKYQE
jgi:hypothetical protein